MGRIIYTPGSSVKVRGGNLGKAAGSIEVTRSGVIADIPDASAGPVKELKAEIVPAQAGTGDPSPENIRPISGWNGARIRLTGRNLIGCRNAYTDMTAEGGWYVENSACRCKLTGLPAGEPFTLSCVLDAKLAADSQNRLYAYAGTNGFIDLSQGAGRYSITRNTTTDGEFVVGLNNVCRNDINRSSHILDIQVEPGSRMTAFEAYRETVFEAEWEGTVYGGTADLKNGILTVTDGYIASYGGEELPGAWISDRDVYAAGSSPSAGAQVVYKLAEPETRRLDPVTVPLASGGNILKADCGPVTVTCNADTKMYIDNIAADLRALIS